MSLCTALEVKFAISTSSDESFGSMKCLSHVPIAEVEAHLHTLVNSTS
jgi:hypothetical protein